MLSRQIDITYGAIGGFEVFPTAWTITIQNPTGWVMETRSVSVLEVRSPAAIPDAEFDITFPPGSTYHDKRDHISYEVKADGKAVVQDPDASLAEDSSPSQGWERTAWWIAGAGCIVSGLLFALLRSARAES